MKKFIVLTVATVFLLSVGFRMNVLADIRGPGPQDAAAIQVAQEIETGIAWSTARV